MSSFDSGNDSEDNFDFEEDFDVEDVFESDGAADEMTSDEMKFDDNDDNFEVRLTKNFSWILHLKFHCIYDRSVTLLKDIYRRFSCRSCVVYS